MSGTGTELKKLLAAFGTYEVKGCKYRDRAATMDKKGTDWCAENVPTIAGWLKEEATKRGMPFVDMVARLVIRRAIHNARKEATSNATKENAAGKEI